MFRCFTILLVFIFAVSCTNDDAVSVKNEKEILSFQFEEELNSEYLTESISGSITDYTINLMIPDIVDLSSIVASFEYVGKTVYVATEQQNSGISKYDFTKPVSYEVHAEDGSITVYKVQVTLLPDVASEVPHLYITTENNDPITSKEEYLWANLQIDGKGVYDDFEGRTRIRGRGHDSWNQPKKPYRLKLDSKASLLGLLPEKDWILRSNYRAESLMLDAVAFRIAGLLGMPFTNHAIPVDVTINNEYMGSYTFTEQKEVKPNRINVGDGGMYLNLDVYMHKPPGLFYSDYYELPVMVRYPKFKNFSPDEVQRELDKAKNDFHAMEATIADPTFPNNNYTDFFDLEDFVNYLIVYNLSLNREINHPKSTYMHKQKDGKYKMGPVWDFDWAFGYDPGQNTHFNNPQQSLFVASDFKGKIFFSRFLEDPVVQSLYKERWEDFKVNKYPELKAYILNYAETISGSYELDYAVWGQGVGSSEAAAQQLIYWLDQRIVYMDSFAADL
ncbi:MAG TPA: CotH kinase family protein [Flavobacteriaceae bacterium]|nr:CotH kinase family protein [Flavobacteriaceae bacterium]